jgi:mono/diheme cytochrome c family protein
MQRWMKRLLVSLCLIVVALVVAVPSIFGMRTVVGPRMRPLTNRTFERTPARMERGRYLAESGQAPCVLCHSPLDPSGGGLTVVDGKAYAGRSFAPEGTAFVTASNLTPDRETGIGTWSDDMLARAIREGISHDGRALFPIMPYQKFRDLSDEDLASIIVYLRSVPPVRNPLPPSAVPFPLSRLINEVPTPITAPVTADLSTPVKRGEYIVTIAVCADCHTTRDDQGNAPKGMDFAGGTLMPFEGRRTVATANLTPAVNGIPYYTEELFIEAFRTGKVRSRTLDAMMPIAAYKQMTDQDLKDIFAFLKTLPPVDHFVDNSLPPTKCTRCGLTHGGGERNKLKG